MKKPTLVENRLTVGVSLTGLFRHSSRPLVHTRPVGPWWRLVRWTQVARLAFIPRTLVAHTNNQPNNLSNSPRHQSPS